MLADLSLSTAPRSDVTLSSLDVAAVFNAVRLCRSTRQRVRGTSLLGVGGLVAGVVLAALGVLAPLGATIAAAAVALAVAAVAVLPHPGAPALPGDPGDSTDVRT